MRLLLDDYNLGSDSDLIALSVHPKIQVRVFNPVLFRPRWARLLEYALHFHRATRRMHNKLFIVDNEFTILGGRNVGNDYFNVRANNVFRDFDILIAGPVTAQASSAFDRVLEQRLVRPGGGPGRADANRRGSGEAAPQTEGAGQERRAV